MVMYHYYTIDTNLAIIYYCGVLVKYESILFNIYRVFKTRVCNKGLLTEYISYDICDG